MPRGSFMEGDPDNAFPHIPMERLYNENGSTTEATTLIEGRGGV